MPRDMVTSKVKTNVELNEEVMARLTANMNSDTYGGVYEDGVQVEAFATKDSGERQQFDSGMQRDTTEGKINWLLIRSGPMLKRWAELMTRGALKYDDDNWMKADSMDEYNRFRSSAARHFEQWLAGDRDEDHAAAVMFNMNGAEYVSNRIEDAKAGIEWDKAF